MSKNKNNKDYEYINKFKEIKLIDICKELHLDPSNLYAGRMSNHHVHKVRVALENRINQLGTKKEYRKIRSKKRRIKNKYENINK